jgi:simple sugar transport system permease protein
MDSDNILIGTVSRALAYSTPLLCASLGEICAERAGVVNLGVEGMMILGALSGFAMAQITGDPWIGVAAAAGAGGLTALVHGFAVITLRANQYVSGLSITMIGLGLSSVLGKRWVGIPLDHPLPQTAFPALAEWPVVGPMLFSRQSSLTYLVLGLAVLLWFLLFHSRWGNVVRSVGHAPGAADARGVPVFWVRYLAVIWGGVLAGIAGGFLSLHYQPAWNEGMTVGMGWIALAIGIFSAWNPLRAVWAAFFFGALYHLSFRLQAWVAPELLRMMPYLFVVLALTFAQRRRGNDSVPAALGLPYWREDR